MFILTFFLKVSRSFDQLPKTKSLELSKLWADALEKDGRIELAIKKAQEANDKVKFMLFLMFYGNQFFYNQYLMHMQVCYV